MVTFPASKCVCPLATLFHRMKANHLTNNYGINPVISNKELFSNMTFCQVNRQLCNSFLWRNGHVQASASFPFHYQQWCLKTVIEVITVIQTSSHLPRKSMMSLNDRKLVQFLCCTLKWLLSTVAGSDQHGHVKFLCGRADELAAPPCSALQSRMQCVLPLLCFKQQRQ